MIARREKNRKRTAIMATIIEFPAIGPFCVRVEREREGGAWLVLCKSNGWLHGNLQQAIADAKEVAQGFGYMVRVAS